MQLQHTVEQARAARRVRALHLPAARLRGGCVHLCGHVRCASGTLSHMLCSEIRRDTLEEQSGATRDALAGGGDACSWHAHAAASLEQTCWRTVASAGLRLDSVAAPCTAALCKRTSRLPPNGGHGLTGCCVGKAGSAVSCMRVTGVIRVKLAGRMQVCAVIRSVCKGPCAATS